MDAAVRQRNQFGNGQTHGIHRQSTIVPGVGEKRLSLDRPADVHHNTSGPECRIIDREQTSEPASPTGSTRVPGTSRYRATPANMGCIEDGFREHLGTCESGQPVSKLTATEALEQHLDDVRVGIRQVICEKDYGCSREVREVMSSVENRSLSKKSVRQPMMDALRKRIRMSRAPSRS